MKVRCDPLGRVEVLVQPEVWRPVDEDLSEVGRFKDSGSELGSRDCIRRV